MEIKECYGNYVGNLLNLKEQDAVYCFNREEHWCYLEM